jgi:hypothetical protein
MSAVAQAKAGWSRLIPDLAIGAKARSAFWRFFGITSVIVFAAGEVVHQLTHDSSGPSGINFLLVYWFLFPGCLGAVWWFAYTVWMHYAVDREWKRAEQDVQRAFKDAAKRYGEVRFLDTTVRLSQASGIAIAGTSLLFLQDNHWRKVARNEIRSWRWEIESPTLRKRESGGTMVSRQMENEAEQARVAQSNGFCIVTNDPRQPELLFRTDDKATCTRWETILNNVLEGRMQID